MTLDEIRWMTKLFQTQNMSKAAEALFISQPALSQCLKRIETQLGFALFERSNKGLTPTEKGLLFFQSATNITENYERFLIQAELSNHMELHQITIGMAPYLSSCCSADIIRQLHNVYPQIDFYVMEANLDNQLDALQKNVIQLGISSGAISVPGITTHTFATGQMVIFLRNGSPCAEYAYEEKGKQYLDPRHLSNEPIALTRFDQASRRLAEALIREAGFEPRIQQESYHLSTLYRYAQTGLATSIVPLSIKEEEKDHDNHLIHFIPNTYHHSTCCCCILAMPKIDRIVPDRVYDIIQSVVQSNDSYAKLI